MYPAPPAILPTNTSHKEILSAQLYEFKNWIYWKVQSWKYMIEKWRKYTLFEEQLKLTSGKHYVAIKWWFIFKIGRWGTWKDKIVREKDWQFDVRSWKSENWGISCSKGHVLYLLLVVIGMNLFFNNFFFCFVERNAKSQTSCREERWTTWCLQKNSWSTGRWALCKLDQIFFTQQTAV